MTDKVRQLGGEGGVVVQAKSKSKRKCGYGLTLGAGERAGPQRGRGCGVTGAGGVQGAHGRVQAVQDGVGSSRVEAVRCSSTQET